MDNENKIEVKAYTLQELANLYDVSRHTFRKWLKPFLSDIGCIEGHTLTPKQVLYIFEQLGRP